MNCKKAVALISSGIDSPVASWIMIKKGVELIGVHCSSDPPGTSKSTDLTKRMCKQIGIKKLYIINHAPVQQMIENGCKSSLVCILCKRFMIRFADSIAKKEGCCCIITGDNIGQVASQTLENMVVITSATNLPILRPILCNDKHETTTIAREIGTYEIGLDSPPCCSFVPDRPATKTFISTVETEEKRIDVDKIVEDALSAAEVVSL